MMLSFVRVRSLFVAVVCFGALGLAALAQRTGNRIAGPIDDGQVVTLSGNVHPMARGEFDLGAVADETVLERMVLELEPSAAQQAELDDLVEAQHDPQSPEYQQWLTPAEYGVRFGASAADVARITAWLRGHGFRVDEVAASNRLIEFSGTAAHVAETFHTEIHRYKVDGVEHIANVQDPQIPAAFAGVVGGVLSLHDFRRSSEISARKPLNAAAVKVAEGARALSFAVPEYTSGSTHYLYPADWATIYDLNSLYSAGKTGAGASIAIVGRSNINLSDVATFRSASGLPANQPTVILVSTNPGLLAGDQDESTLDVEWSGATAPGAAVKFVVGASTSTTDGVDLSAQYIVNHATATVMSTSYGSCEQDMGSTELAFYNGLWQQAASEGISAFVSSGDSGAAGCNGGSSSTGSGKGVNGLCSSPYSTCVGGTEFNEGSSAAKYWSATNSSTEGSALGYIPEEVWNESALDGGSGLWASTGGASVLYTEPSWQKNITGTSAANGMRAVPDVAMTAASHDGYIVVEDGSYWVLAGTSAASPSFAGVIALVVQAENGKGQGCANPGLYALVSASKNPFHATPSGNNSVPGVTGFAASGGEYNLATGLGSVDGAVLVSEWGAGATSSVNFAMTQSAASGTALTGKTVTFTVGVTESGTVKNAVTLTAKTPAGVTASISPTSITPGTTATVTLTVGTTAAAGAQSVTITGSDSSGTQTLSYALTVTQPPTLVVTAGASTASIAQGGKAAVSLNAATGGSFAGNINWSLTGLPSGVTAGWSANPQTPSAGASTSAQTLTLTAAATATATSATVTVTAAGDGLTATSKVTLTVTKLTPALTFAPASTAVSVAAGKSVTDAIAIAGNATYSGAVSLSVSGLPTGVTAAWSSSAVTLSAESGSSTLTLTAASTAKAGTSTITVTASGDGVSATKQITLTVTQAAGLQLTLSASSIAMTHTASASVTVLLTELGGLNIPTTLTLSGLPAGVTPSLGNVSVGTSGSESGLLTFTGSTKAVAGTSTLIIGVSGVSNGVTYTATQTLSLQLK
jgi:pseudomonalisin